MASGRAILRIFSGPSFFQTPLRSQMNGNGRNDPVRLAPRKKVFMKKGAPVCGDGFATRLLRQRFSLSRLGPQA